MSRSRNSEPKTVQVGNIIHDKFQLIKRLGHGAFGDIFEATYLSSNSKPSVAIKFESKKAVKSVLNLEYYVLKKLQKLPYFAKYYVFGTYHDQLYLAMELLGPNLAELISKQPNKTFTYPTVLKIGAEMVKALKAMHSIQWVHRDIKPSNFVIGRGSHDLNRIYLIDFGLAKRTHTENGEEYPKRSHVGFRGTARYASLRAHRFKDLSRVDDLWSVLYCLYEFLIGKLPWNDLKERKEIGYAKEEFADKYVPANQFIPPTNDYYQAQNDRWVKKGKRLCADLPPVFLEMEEYLRTQSYFDVPNYDLLISNFSSALNQLSLGHLKLPSTPSHISHLNFSEKSDITRTNVSTHASTPEKSPRTRHTTGNPLIDFFDWERDAQKEKEQNQGQTNNLTKNQREEQRARSKQNKEQQEVKSPKQPYDEHKKSRSSRFTLPEIKPFDKERHEKKKAQQNQPAPPQTVEPSSPVPSHVPPSVLIHKQSNSSPLQFSMDYPAQTAPQQIPSPLHNDFSPLLFHTHHSPQVQHLFNMSKGSPTEQLSPLLQHNFTANSGTPTPTPTFSPLATNPFMNLVHSARTNTHHPDTDKYLSLNNLNETTESLSQRSTFASFSLVSGNPPTPQPTLALFPTNCSITTLTMSRADSEITLSSFLTDTGSLHSMGLIAQTEGIMEGGQKLSPRNESHNTLSRSTTHVERKERGLESSNRLHSKHTMDSNTLQTPEPLSPPPPSANKRIEASSNLAHASFTSQQLTASQETGEKIHNGSSGDISSTFSATPANSTTDSPLHGSDHQRNTSNEPTSFRTRRGSVRIKHHETHTPQQSVFKQPTYSQRALFLLNPNRQLEQSESLPNVPRTSSEDSDLFSSDDGMDGLFRSRSAPHFSCQHTNVSFDSILHFFSSHRCVFHKSKLHSLLHAAPHHTSKTQIEHNTHLNTHQHGFTSVTPSNASAPPPPQKGKETEKSGQTDSERHFSYHHGSSDEKWTPEVPEKTQPPVSPIGSPSSTPPTDLSAHGGRMRANQSEPVLQLLEVGGMDVTQKMFCPSARNVPTYSMKKAKTAQTIEDIPPIPLPESQYIQLDNTHSKRERGAPQQPPLDQPQLDAIRLSANPNRQSFPQMGRSQMSSSHGHSHPGQQQTGLQGLLQVPLEQLFNYPDDIKIQLLQELAMSIQKPSQMGAPPSQSGQYGMVDGVSPHSGMMPGKSLLQQQYLARGSANAPNMIPRPQKQQSSAHRKKRRQKTGSDVGSLLQKVSIKQPITFDHKLEPVEPEIIHQTGPSPFRSGQSLMASSFLTESPSTGHLKIPDDNTEMHTPRSVTIAARTHIFGNPEAPMIRTGSVVSLDSNEGSDRTLSRSQSITTLESRQSPLLATSHLDPVDTVPFKPKHRRSPSVPVTGNMMRRSLHTESSPAMPKLVRNSPDYVIINGHSEVSVFPPNSTASELQTRRLVNLTPLDTSTNSIEFSAGRILSPLVEADEDFNVRTHSSNSHSRLSSTNDAMSVQTFSHSHPNILLACPSVADELANEEKDEAANASTEDLAASKESTKPAKQEDDSLRCSCLLF
ncbi:putative Tau-tubulin kinase 1 [Blattamonas nauphoetae]|uniref:Tau-tubulin kinase 1 n=1 Tax=Blattamonas nauphoetae TaxID=2049346 RepID=A0ABQ9WYX5_9EUKA|nr:putative Tau-tubulin kinase 1 [Blattamonas nauphoetae]